MDGGRGSSGSAGAPGRRRTFAIYQFCLYVGLLVFGKLIDVAACVVVGGMRWMVASAMFTVWTNGGLLRDCVLGALVMVRDEAAA